MALPERVPGFVVEGGRAVGHDLPSLDSRESLAPWREAIGGRVPFFVRLEADDPSVIAHVQRLARVGELWLDTPLRGVDDALDLMVAGAARLAVPFQGADGELLEAVGPSALIRWDGASPWADVEAAALAHDVPVVSARDPPADAACDAYLFRNDGRPTFLLARVARAPHPTPGEGQPQKGDEILDGPAPSLPGGDLT